jgi:RNA polymerase primary sigma factor
VAKPTVSNEELCARLHAGDRLALSALVKQNQGLIWLIAKRYARKCTSLDIEDLVNEGAIGVMHAAETFDVSFGTKFSTHAMQWIRAKVGRAAANDSTRMKLAQRAKLVHLVDKFVRLVEELVGQGMNRNEARAQVKKELGLRRGLAEDLEAFGRAKHLSSLDAPTYDGTDSTLHDVLSGDEDVDTEGDLDTDTVMRRVDGVRGTLDAREIAVLDGRLMGAETLEDIAQKFDLSRERVRQIEELLIKKLRSVLTVEKGGVRVLRKLRLGPKMKVVGTLRVVKTERRRKRRGSGAPLVLVEAEPLPAIPPLPPPSEERIVEPRDEKSEAEARSGWVHKVLVSRATPEAVAARFNYATGNCFTCGQNVPSRGRQAHVLAHDKALLGVEEAASSG